MRIVAANLSIVVLLTLTAVAPARAATDVAVEYGAAAVENYGVTANVGVSVFYDFTPNITGALNYTHWLGNDDNYSRDRDDTSSWSNAVYYGNDAYHVSALYRLIERPKLDVLLGGGLGGYESIMLEQNNTEKRISSFTAHFVSLVEYKVNRDVSVYGKGLVSSRFPASLTGKGLRDADIAPRWLFLNIGFSYRLPY